MTVELQPLQYEPGQDVLEEQTPVLERWEDCDIRLLISCYAAHKHMFANAKSTKKEIFSKVAQSFNAKSSKKVTAEQCSRKWAKLQVKLKEVEDHNRQTGRDRKSWKFLDEMLACVGSSPKINPAVTIDTSAGSNTGLSSNSSSCPDDYDDGTDNESSGETAGGKSKKIKLPNRKRKSNSSAAEMLRFLQTYSERREKAEAEKLQLLKSMEEEKKEFFTQFLDVLKEKKSN